MFLWRLLVRIEKCFNSSSVDKMSRPRVEYSNWTN